MASGSTTTTKRDQGRTGMGWVPAERRAIVATLQETDPDATTLCGGWTARHVLAHLVQREQKPFTRIADQLSKAPPGEERFQSRMVARAGTQEGYLALMGRFLRGPHIWSPVAWAPETFNLLEFVVHHEDIRRGGPEPAEPRTLPKGQDKSVWRRVSPVARLYFRRSPVPVSLATSDGRARVVKGGPDGVTLTGDPVEIALYLGGRREAARVALTGSTAA